jgi:dTDP-4-dehydrorhamnose 3,5-epimerase
MNFVFPEISGLVILTPDVFNDDRGFFFESYSKKTLSEILKIDLNFVQDNESYSTFGVVRGLHYQLPPFEQGKLVRIIKGAVKDIAVDIRENSPTYGKYFSIDLNDINKKQIYIPPGFAHGFITLSEIAILNYKCTNYYNKESEGGIVFNDPFLNIDWELQNFIVSEKDKKLPFFGEHRKYYPD